MTLDFDWFTLFGFALVAFAGFTLYEVRSIHLLLKAKQ